MAWISVHEQILGMKLRELSKAIGCSQKEALGILVSLWLWGIHNADRDGLLKGADKKDIIEAMSGGLSTGLSVEKVVECLFEYHWIDTKEHKFYLHDWDYWQEHWYKALDRRNYDAQRKRGERNKQCPPECPPDSPQGNPVQPLPNRNRNRNLKTNKDILLPIGSTSVGKPDPPYQDLLDFYNQHRRKMPEAKTLSQKRKGFINARTEKYGLEAVKEVILKAEKSDFLNGGGKKGWIAPGFDWIMSPENFPKVFEGKYENQAVQKDDWRL